jgi:hypothetical protein
VRECIQAMVEGELDAALMRPRYGRRSQSSSGDADGPVGVLIGHRHKSARRDDHRPLMISSPRLCVRKGNQGPLPCNSRASVIRMHSRSKHNGC